MESRNRIRWICCAERIAKWFADKQIFGTGGNLAMKLMQPRFTGALFFFFLLCKSIRASGFEIGTPALNLGGLGAGNDINPPHLTHL